MKPHAVRRYAAVFCVFLLLALPALASGHAFPENCDPKVGSTVTSQPTSVRVWFDSPLEPLFSKITVLDGQGARVDKGDGGVDGSDPKLLKASVNPLRPGYYRVVWDVVARDGHRTTGNFKFLVK